MKSSAPPMTQSRQPATASAALFGLLRSTSSVPRATSPAPVQQQSGAFLPFRFTFLPSLPAAVLHFIPQRAPRGMKRTPSRRILRILPVFQHHGRNRSPSFPAVQTSFSGRFLLLQGVFPSILPFPLRGVFRPVFPLLFSFFPKIKNARSAVSVRFPLPNRAVWF